MPPEIIGAIVVLIFGSYLGWVVRGVIAGDFQPFKEREQTVLEIHGDCPIISWDHLKGHYLVFEGIRQYKVGERRLWIAQAFDAKDGAIAFYIENPSLALDITEVKRGENFILVENNDETISVGRLK